MHAVQLQVELKGQNLFSSGINLVRRRRLQLAAQLERPILGTPNEFDTALLKRVNYIATLSPWPFIPRCATNQLARARHRRCRENRCGNRHHLHPRAHWGNEAGTRLSSSYTLAQRSQGKAHREGPFQTPRNVAQLLQLALCRAARLTTRCRRLGC